MNNLIKLTASLFLFLSTALYSSSIFASANNAIDTNSEKSIVEIAKAAGSFNTLLAALDAAGLTHLLDSPGRFTVFAPTDEAFARVPKPVLSSLLRPENKKALQDILLYHVVSGKISSEQAISAAINNIKVETLSGERIRPSFQGPGLVINQAKVLDVDINASNGVIHVIDRVLLPRSQKMDVFDTASTFEELETFTYAVKAAGLDHILKTKKSLAVFAPTNAAFKALPHGVLEQLLLPENIHQLRDLLKLHVGQTRFNLGAINANSAIRIRTLLGHTTVEIKNKGGELFVNDVKVIVKDILTRNGYIHIVDAVLSDK